jgi:hypothetical protein
MPGRNPALERKPGKNYFGVTLIGPEKYVHVVTSANMDSLSKVDTPKIHIFNMWYLIFENRALLWTPVSLKEASQADSKMIQIWKHAMADFLCAWNWCGGGGGGCSMQSPEGLSFVQHLQMHVDGKWGIMDSSKLERSKPGW